MGAQEKMAGSKKARSILDKKPWLLYYYYPVTGSRYEALRYNEK